MTNLYLYTIFYQCHVDIIDQAEYGVHDRLHIYPCVGYFTSPGIDTIQKGPTAFSVPSKRHWQSGVKGIPKVYKRPQWFSNPRPLDHQSRAVITASDIISKVLKFIQTLKYYQHCDSPYKCLLRPLCQRLTQWLCFNRQSSVLNLWEKHLTITLHVDAVCYVYIGSTMVYVFQ